MSNVRGSTYADQFADWLCEVGYTHCFFVAGGNIMHLLNSARSRFVCVPFVNEVAAGIAAEYFNECREESGGRAFALVTAGPGLTNTVTAMAGAYLESRELLVVGGQVKSSDLASEGLRQRGIQEVDGIAIVQSLCVATLRITQPLSRDQVMAAIARSWTPRKGPTFIEFTLDAQGAPEIPTQGAKETRSSGQRMAPVQISDVDSTLELLRHSNRPIILIGGGVSRNSMRHVLPHLEDLGVPIATTWNGADRIGADHELYFGRPNTWGMRWANVLCQQADLLIAVGTRLGLQQTGFNWQGFAPLANIVQVDIDAAELRKGHPHTTLSINADSESFLNEFTKRALALGFGDATQTVWSDWRRFGMKVRNLLPLADPANEHAAGYLDPFQLVQELSAILTADDLLIPCSSGGGFTVTMQAFEQKSGQVIASNKGLASMGYGLSGAIGAALANPGRRTILVEGDGGFAQSLQEVGTLVAQQLPVKVFLFANDGYASIRMTQRNYFGGAYVGCDARTGLGTPNWDQFFKAYDLEAIRLDSQDPWSETVMDELASPGPSIFIVPIDPEQTYYPKITSRMTDSGAMESNPLHRMSPDLPPNLRGQVLVFLEDKEVAHE